MPGNVEQWLSLALWLAAAGHFLVLGASFQVPFRLHWKEDLAKLAPFNRKLMWVHGAFAIYTIISFGVLSLLLHGEMVRGDRAALALAFFMVCIGCCASSLILRITRIGTGRAARRFGSDMFCSRPCLYFCRPVS